MDVVGGYGASYAHNNPHTLRGADIQSKGTTSWMDSGGPLCSGDRHSGNARLRGLWCEYHRLETPIASRPISTTPSVVNESIQVYEKVNLCSWAVTDPNIPYQGANEMYSWQTVVECLLGRENA